MNNNNNKNDHSAIIFLEQDFDVKTDKAIKSLTNFKQYEF